MALLNYLSRSASSFISQVLIICLNTSEIFIYVTQWWEKSRNVASLNILVDGLINLLYYEHLIEKRKYFYEVNKSLLL